MPQESQIQIIHDYFDAICSLDCDSWVANFAAEATSFEPGNPPLAGHDALRMFFNGVAAGFETIEMRPTQIYPVGNEAAVKWAARGTGKNGREVTFEGIDIFSITTRAKSKR